MEPLIAPTFSEDFTRDLVRALHGAGIRYRQGARISRASVAALRARVERESRVEAASSATLPTDRAEQPSPQTSLF